MDGLSGLWSRVHVIDNLGLTCGVNETDDRPLFTFIWFVYPKIDFLEIESFLLPFGCLHPNIFFLFFSASTTCMFVPRIGLDLYFQFVSQMIFSPEAKRLFDAREPYVSITLIVSFIHSLCFFFLSCYRVFVISIFRVFVISIFFAFYISIKYHFILLSSFLSFFLSFVLRLFLSFFPFFPDFSSLPPLVHNLAALST